MIGGDFIVNMQKIFLNTMQKISSEIALLLPITPKKINDFTHLYPQC